MRKLRLNFDGKGDATLESRAFSVQEGISEIFSLSVVAMSPSADVDLSALVGRPVVFEIESGAQHVSRWGRKWRGIVSNIEHVQTEVSDEGRSTYSVEIVPELWLLTQRRNYRIFQHVSIPDIVDEIFTEWKTERKWKIRRGEYPKLEYKVQYGESDYAFVRRLLEEAGIAFHFQHIQQGSTLTLADNLTLGELHKASPIPYVDNPNQAAQKEFVSEVRIVHGVRPGSYTLRDHDFRNPGFPLFEKTTAGTTPETNYEQYHYLPGAFLAETGKASNTPVADRKGIARHDANNGKGFVELVRDAERTGKRQVSFITNVFGLEPGELFTIDDHPRNELHTSKQLLITDCRMEGTAVGEWSMDAKAVFAAEPYRPPMSTPKPEVKGVQSATVVGPPGEEIHTDEFGRVRVQFPWDREGKNDDNSSCWMRVSQGWAGAAFGSLNLPRIGQEVLVGFLVGDPDQPIIVGRVFNGTNQVPYKLPDHKTRSTWRSDSSPRGGGFNEILFEDLAKKELVYIQAQKNLRKLVLNDETITVVNDRQRFVKNDDLETTGRNRMEVTLGERTEITDADRTYAIGKDRRKLVKADEIEITQGAHQLVIGKSQDLVVKATQKEQIGGDAHLQVKGDRRRAVGGKDSLTVGGSRHVKVKKSHLLDAGDEIHLKAGTELVIEASRDLTLKGPGGFIRINAMGITIVGTLVNINSGGIAGMVSTASPDAADAAVEAKIVEPKKPEPDDVSKTRLGQ
ncbi:type VI secretion system Vgr family protein [Chondromyces crocatus]|uniref:Type IV secretion protein Rhs n=1 Tax=Chondromyces crocatus TaxID=52 RepID=A0A0K1EKM2_CHOCO|nr:type VI secretion system tip protein TssI/VgrG [Chondromyces crocatus]AKT41138.1 type IV secretion protein Rhs [Chondromyces crocatus]